MQESALHHHPGMRGHHAMTALKEEPLGTSVNHLHSARSWMQPTMHHAIEHGG